MSELQLLVHEIGAKWEDIPGDTITEKAIGIIEWAKRRGRIQQLIQIVARLRPD